MFKKLRYAFLIIIIVATMVNISYADKIAYFPPYPKDINIFITKPEIGMKLKLNDNEIESIEMKVNGTSVNAEYDESREMVYYRPAAPLSFGQHSVDLTIHISGWTNYFSQSWNFTISENAVNTYSPVNQNQISALDYVNDFRNKLGLSPLSISKALNAAANAHTNYMIYNSKLTHNELPGDKGFSGGTPFIRAKSYGYNGIATAENVSSGYDDQTEALKAFIAAPYHRLAWLNPYADDFGYAGKSNYRTVLFGTISEGDDKEIYYPYNMQKDVPLSWENTETPDPLKGINDQSIGYPITISYFSEKNVISLDVKSVTLRDDNAKKIKEIYINEPSKDKYLSDSLIIIPKEPLNSNTKYYVDAEFTVIFDDGSKKELNKFFSFTTVDVRTYAFEDISDHWALDYIENLVNDGIISTNDGSNFYPDTNITRGDFCQYIVKMLDLQLKYIEGEFSDVSSSTSNAKYIEAAKKYDIVNGYEDGTFKPNNNITRQEIAVIMKRVYELETGDTDAASDHSLSFSDNADIPSWAEDGVKLCNKLKIINGRPGGVFDPSDFTTRAEAATMIKRLQDVL
ncbi:MAG: S-layer homology domain-containing protein [Clostridia bacterium]|nr:S-layer homology domain-containing protein [Clostridia bacterium]